MATLATLRLREDDLRARLDAVRGRLASCLLLGALGSLAYANLVGQGVVEPSHATQGF